MVKIGIIPLLYVYYTTQKDKLKVFFNKNIKIKSITSRTPLKYYYFNNEKSIKE